MTQALGRLVGSGSCLSLPVRPVPRDSDRSLVSKVDEPGRSAPGDSDGSLVPKADERRRRAEEDRSGSTGY